MKIHCHIPKLYEFAIDVACDYVVEHGAAGLDKPIPYVLYLKSQIAYAHKYGNKLTVKKLFDKTRDNSVNIACHNCRASTIVILDHCSLDESPDLSTVIHCLIEESDSDVDGVIECLGRFACRCAMAGTHELLISTMIYALKQTPCKAIRQLLIQYGGHLDPNDFGVAVRCGMSNMVKTAIENGQQVNEYNLLHAFESGDLDTIKLVANASPNMRFVCGWNGATLRDNSVDVCEMMHKLGILHQGKRYHFHSITNTDVLQWLHDHDMIDMDASMASIVGDAVSKGGQYRDVLYYLIERLHVCVPKDIMFAVENSRLHFNAADLGVYDFLLAHGADVNAASRMDSLITACPELLRYWIDNGVNIDGAFDLRLARLVAYQVAQNLHPSVMKMAIKLLHLNIDNLDDDGQTLLHRRCHELGTAHQSTSSDDDDETVILDVSMDKVKMLLEVGANPNVKDDDGNTALHHASLGHLECTAVLIKHGGANVNILNENGDTALHHACTSSDLSLVQLLIDHDADVSISNNAGQTPLHIINTLRSGDHWRDDEADEKIAALLMYHGADVKAVDNDGQTALHMLCDGVRDDESGGGYNRLYAYQNPAVSDVNSPCVSIAKLLIKHGADVNARDISGKTPLKLLNNKHIDCLGMATVLLNNGAKKTDHDMSRMSRIAIARYDHDAFEVMLKHGANPNALDSKRMTLLARCIRIHDCTTRVCDFIASLMNHGADARLLGNNDGVKLLKLACLNDIIEPFEQLIERFNNDKWTGYDMDELVLLASKESSTRVVEYLIQHGGKPSQSLKRNVR